MKARVSRELAAAALSMMLLALSACAKTSSEIAFHEESIASDQDDAAIYLYRVASFVGCAVAFPVRLDGKQVAVLKQNAYVVLRAPPGEHEVVVGESYTLALAINQAITKKSRTLTATPEGVYLL
jgi:hypothetical protein